MAFLDDDPALREAVASYYQRRQGIERSPDDILVGPGSKELMFILQLVYYGDLVVPTPAWVSYAPQAHILGKPVTYVPTRPETNYELELDEGTVFDPEDRTIQIVAVDFAQTLVIDLLEGF